ncbi:glutaminyl-tRNA synthase (glutamine-hydrolyzing) subunit A [Candidatus Campbellbacteria bacterium RIFOXYC2_FULL_35_25]|uniref:Glutamyl-tRNA(Gln) amidotransferase subunit A n=1 Tax=Candidatus Campbellbacteria bacterium RIFOXYC2_FULL_35_25 TaxID=1797582 RepID=A0A1F5EIE2_9BACT|nr:MAG: glutaminyl-tRNA synthase (glutamine-hydrolyzing) subunit A [Candidatus Campbellbacteria bacterium RIFOXYC2_FULL_35_25]
MTKINLTDLTIRKAHEAMKTGDFSARELTQTYLNKITEVNPNLNAYLHLFDGALKQADEADKRFKDGTAELLTGIPMAIKNNICIKGEITTAASKILENYRAIYDATVIEKLRKAGAVFLGGTNMDEFAMGGSTENSAYGVTKNPYDDTRVSGGSSGGSVVAVAMDGSLASLGTDTGGSIRQPSSFCGTVGLKTTYGRVSRYGAIAMGSSLDQIGPVTKNVADAEIIFDCIKGDDDMDSTTIPENLIKELKVKEKMTIGIPRHFMKEGIDEDVMKNFDESIEKLKSLGHVIKDIEIPNIDYALATYYIIMPAEVSTNLSRFDGVRFGLYKDGGENLLQDYMKTRAEGFGPEARRRIILGTYVLSAGYYDAYYDKATALREVMKKDFTKAFEEVDIILTPTAPTPAFKIGEKSDDPVQMYLSDIFTVSANMVGVPALAVPSGFTERDSKQLPLGIQFMAPWMGENILFEIGKDFLGEK